MVPLQEGTLSRKYHILREDDPDSQTVVWQAQEQALLSTLVESKSGRDKTN
jgi:hypothetical protein